MTRGVVPTRTPTLVSVLVIAQIADVLTTLYGMRLPGVEERNPIALPLVDALGPATALIAISFVSIVIVVTVTEGAAAFIEHGTVTPTRLRWLGYLPHILISTAAVTNNVIIITLA